MRCLDIKKVPFSYPGSYYTVQQLFNGDADGIYIRSLHHDAWEPKAVQLITEEEVRIRVLPYELCMETDKGLVRFCFAGTKGIAFRTEGISLCLRYEKASQMTRREQGIWEVNCFGQNMKAMLCIKEGEARGTFAWDGDNCTDIRHVVSEYSEGVLYFVKNCGSGMSGLKEETIVSYEEWEEKNRKEFEGWMEKSQKPEAQYRDAYELASYINWSSLVEPYGQITCPTMYASKVSMLGIWSWDHCFHTLGIWDIDRKAAFEQWRLMFEKQADDGSLPDRVEDAVCYWSFSKPPVHGYFLNWMRHRGLILSVEEKKYAYIHLKQWTEYWFRYHDSDKDGIPEYDNGNDSGWDNNTVMVKGGPLESPDLSMWLILQMDCLKELAGELSLPEEADQWKQRADKLTGLFCGHFWDEEKKCMTGRISGTHETVYSDSLILYLPLLLGRRLPERILKKMVEDLKQDGAFLTEHGFATERLQSQWYSADGYWRGPIWGPSTFLLCEGLKLCSEYVFADEIRVKFLSMCAEKMAMPENFDAVTGEALRDSALVWTASVFVRMAADR